MARGKLIVFEGLDRAGKSTQVEMLVAALNKEGVKVQHRRFPGKLIEHHILDPIRGESCVGCGGRFMKGGGLLTLVRPHYTYRQDD